MTRWNRSTLPPALLAIGVLATSAGAQPAPAPKKQPTQQELDGARAHFKAAEAAKTRRDYKTAAAEYLAAYELFEDPEFFFDVGEVYRLAGDEPNAFTYYQKYLQLEPNGRGATAARTAADELRRSIAAKQEAAKRAADDEAKRKANEEAKRKADRDAAQRAAAVAVQANPPPAPEPSAPGGRGLRVAAEAAPPPVASTGPAVSAHPPVPLDMPAQNAPATSYLLLKDPIGLALLGAGAVGTGVGIGVLVSARSEHIAALDAQTLDETRRHSDKARSRLNLGFGVGGVGAGLVIGGGVWYLLRRGSGEQRTVTGWLAPGSGGLAITGAF